MNQNQQPRAWWKDKRLVWALAALTLAGLLITTILGYLLSWEWTGFVDIQDNPDTRLAWDWLELLIIPLALGIGALFFNQQARKREQELAEDRAREDALRSYFDRMSELLLDRNLGKSDKGTVEQIVANARALAVIRSLEGDQRGRKSQVIRFVSESNLIQS